jgi:hypothetical protein
VFTPVLAKHTKSFNLIDTLSVGVDRIQRNFEPLERQVETWRKTQITDATAKLIFYSAFIDGKLEAPRSLLPEVSSVVFRAGISGVLAANDVAVDNVRLTALERKRDHQRGTHKEETPKPCWPSWLRNACAGSIRW